MLWIGHAKHGQIRGVRLEDLTDPSPLSERCVAIRFQGHGLGIEILFALTRHVVTTWRAVDYAEGQTREDNMPMLRIFRHPAWVQEELCHRG